MRAVRSDTTTEAEEFYIRCLQALPPWRKAEMFDDLVQTTRQLTLAGLRSRNPDATEDELSFRLAELVYGSSVASAVFSKRNKQVLR